MNKKIIVVVIYTALFTFSLHFFWTFNNSFNEQEKNEVAITNENSESSISSEMEDYIVGVVACEMPALYQEEALKSQAIASRTYALNQGIPVSDLKESKDQCYITEEQMKEKWGTDFEKYYTLLKNIVFSTKGIVMKKENQLFKSFYFSTSNGYTEDSMSVFNEGELTSVESPWDKTAKNFTVEMTITKEELVEKLGNFNSLQIIKRNTTNHVEEIKVDDKIYTGIEFRKLVNLRSTDFTIVEENGLYKITTSGYGHGVGMSQNGANELAKLGNNYEYILNYYYGNVDFVKM